MGTLRQAGQHRNRNRLGRSTIKVTAPATLAGALASFARQRLKLLCGVTGCGMRAITKVLGITDLPHAAEYEVALDCSHVRTVAVTVNRSTAERAKFSGEPEPDVEQDEVTEAEADEVEAYEIRTEMNEPVDDVAEPEVTAEITI